MSKASNTEQSIEELRERYEELNTRKTVAQTNLKNAEKQLDKLKKKAVDAYGTADVDELREKLKEMKTENERKRKEYQASLDKIDKDLAKVDEEYATGSGGEGDQDEDDDA